jgi:Family of unknown function (DUF5677)
MPSELASFEQCLWSAECLWRSAFNITLAPPAPEKDFRSEQRAFLFSKLTLQSLSFLKLLPWSDFFTAAGGSTEFDLASAATIARNVSENFLSMFYLCFDTTGSSEQELRELVWNLHGASEWKTIKQKLKLGPLGSTFLESERSLKEKISKNTDFIALRPKLQKKLLENPPARFLLDEEGNETPDFLGTMCARSGMSRDLFRATYKYCSNFEHSTFLAVVGMDFAKSEYVQRSGELNNLLNFQALSLAVALRHYLIARPDLHWGVTDELSDTLTVYSEMARQGSPFLLTDKMTSGAKKPPSDAWFGPTVRVRRLGASRCPGPSEGKMAPSKHVSSDESPSQV